MQVPEAAVSVVGAGSEIVVEYAGTRTVLAGRVREIVRLLMRDGEKMHLEDATGVAFDWGGAHTNWRVTLYGTATARSDEGAVDGRRANRLD